MRKFAARYTAVFMMLTMFLTACHVSLDAPGEQEEEEQTVLEFFTWKDEEDYMADMARAFMEKNPEITVYVHALPASEYRQKLEIMFHTDAAVDLFTSSKPSGGTINHAKGYAMDLTPYKDQIDVSGYGPWFDDLREDGKLTMLPYRMSSWVVYYNKQIFDEKGIPYPGPDWTWEDYTETARKLTGTDKNGRHVYGSMSFDLSGSWWRTPARTTGAENPLDPEGRKQLQKAALWSYQMAYEYLAQAKYTEITSVDSFDYNRLFLQGNIGMFFNGEWCLPILNGAIEKEGLDFQYDVASLPHWEGEESYDVATAAVMQVAAKSRHPEEALRFMEFVCMEEGAKILAGSNLLPAWDSPEIRQIFRDSMEMPEHSEYFFSEHKISQILPDSGYEEAMEIVRRYVSQYLLQEISLDQAFDKSEQEMREKGLDVKS